MSNSVKFVKIVTPIALAIALSACGGGSGSSFGSNTGGTGGGTGGGTTETQASSIELSVSSRQLPTDGSSPITITAIAKDANNNAIDGADIIFSVDKDATIIKDATVTIVDDPDSPNSTPLTSVVTAGSIQTATLTPGSRTNQSLTITVISGVTSKSITVEVVGTEVTIDGPQAITLNKENPFVLKLKDSSSKPISYETVVISSEKGNTVTTESNFKTNEAGEIAFNVIGDVSGTDTISASVLGASYEKHIDVSGDEFTLSTTASEEINIDTDAIISFAWLKDGVPQTGKAITLSSTRGVINNQTTVTDASGKASFTIRSSTAGQTIISATTANGLSTTLNREFIATTPAYLNTQADPSLISPNGVSNIIAKVRDVSDNPVKNQIVDFRLDDTVNGVLSGSTAITDSLGRASISYKAGNSSSAKDGVKIRTFIQGHPVVAEDEISLTVGGNALRIVLGEDENIAEDSIFYIKTYGVIVTDSAGNPIQNSAISFTINPTHYYKGFMRVVDTDGDGEGDRWQKFNTVDPSFNGGSIRCISEDFDKDGNLDAGEDINNNGLLEPTNDATITGSGVTDESGKITVEVVYPQSRALWSRQRITAKTLVGGTEFVEETEFDLPILAADVTDIEVGVPNSISPYGYSDRCDTSDNSFSVSVTPRIVNASDGASSNVIENNVWYRVGFINSLGEEVTNQTFNVTSSVATVEMGPNNTFRVSDNDTAIDNSGFFLVFSSNGVDSPLYYQDDDAVTPPPPPAPVVDTTNPTINLAGVNPTVIALNSTYNEPGYVATDDVDGNITGSVTVFGTVDTSTAGDYVLTYQVFDAAGNKGETTRTVRVNP